MRKHVVQGNAQKTKKRKSGKAIGAPKGKGLGGRNDLRRIQ